MRWERARGAPGGWEPGATGSGDADDWFFRTTVDVPGNGATLRFEGLATHATVSVDGAAVATSASMWLPVDVPLAPGSRAVLVHCHALAPLLAQPRKAARPLAHGGLRQRPALPPHDAARAGAGVHARAARRRAVAPRPAARRARSA